MTIELLEKAKDLKRELDGVDAEISFLKSCLKDERIKYYKVEIREADAYSACKLDHHGLLPKFLETILATRLKYRDMLAQEFEDL